MGRFFKRPQDQKARPCRLGIAAGEVSAGWVDVYMDALTGLCSS
jgi:hypothetical protein